MISPAKVAPPGAVNVVVPTSGLAPFVPLSSTSAVVNLSVCPAAIVIVGLTPVNLIDAPVDVASNSVSPSVL